MYIYPRKKKKTKSILQIYFLGIFWRFDIQACPSNWDQNIMTNFSTRVHFFFFICVENALLHISQRRFKLKDTQGCHINQYTSPFWISFLTKLEYLAVPLREHTTKLPAKAIHSTLRGKISSLLIKEAFRDDSWLRLYNEQ